MCCNMYQAIFGVTPDFLLNSKLDMPFTINCHVIHGNHPVPDVVRLGVHNSVSFACDSLTVVIVSVLEFWVVGLVICSEPPQCGHNGSSPQRIFNSHSTAISSLGNYFRG